MEFITSTILKLVLRDKNLEYFCLSGTIKVSLAYCTADSPWNVGVPSKLCRWKRNGCVILSIIKLLKDKGTNDQMRLWGRGGGGSGLRSLYSSSPRDGSKTSHACKIRGRRSGGAKSWGKGVGWLAESS